MRRAMCVSLRSGSTKRATTRIDTSAAITSAASVIATSSFCASSTIWFAADGSRPTRTMVPVITGSIVHVGLDPSAANQMVLEAQKLLVAITLAALVMAALVSILVVARFVDPLRKLTHIARRIVEGDLSQEIQVESGDEVGELA